MKTESVEVSDHLPFWRYVVAPPDEKFANVTFYSLKSARAVYRRSIGIFPWACLVIYKRKWFSRKLEIVEIYQPSESDRLKAFISGDPAKV